MIILFFLALGLLLPTLTGWLALSLIEGRSPVLFRSERWVLGSLLGLTLTMYVTFLLHIGGLVSFTRFGFLLVQLLLTIPLAVLWYYKREDKRIPPPPSAPSKPLPKWLKIIIIILALWITLKVVSGFLLLVGSPPYFDDVFNNWNMRGKAFFLEQALQLELPGGNEFVSAKGVSSYPPTVSMVKTWFVTIRGSWSEGLANGIHLVWYLSALALIFFGIRRLLSLPFALLGTYLLASLPLYLVHGTHAYADVFLSVHIFVVVSLLFHAFNAEDARHRSTYLRLGAFATGLFIFTKNEALVMYLPVLLLILFATLWMLRKQKKLKPQELRTALLWYAGAIAIVALPWIAFKLYHDLPFGNAKAISGLALAWQPGVLRALWITTFFEGNWLLLIPLFLGLLIARPRQAFFSPLAILTLYFAIILAGQIMLYLFTSLSTEALQQTGYARGLIQLMPVVVFITTILLADVLRGKS